MIPDADFERLRQRQLQVMRHQARNKIEQEKLKASLAELRRRASESIRQQAEPWYRWCLRIFED